MDYLFSPQNTRVLNQVISSRPPFTWYKYKPGILEMLFPKPSVANKKGNAFCNVWATLSDSLSTVKLC